MADAAPATKDNAIRRLGILRAAAELICQRGFSETRIADVAKRAEVSSALVIYYFGTRDRLLVEALAHYEDAFYVAAAAAMKESPGFGQRIDRIIRSCCVARENDGSPGDWRLWLDVWAMSTRHSGIADVRVAQDHRWRDLIEEVTREAVDAGELPVVDARQFALSFSALLDGLAIQCVLADTELTPEIARGLAVSYVEATLGISLVVPAVTASEA